MLLVTKMAMEKLMRMMRLMRMLTKADVVRMGEEEALRGASGLGAEKVASHIHAMWSKRSSNLGV
jgi:hypothetical protein